MKKIKIFIHNDRLQQMTLVDTPGIGVQLQLHAYVVANYRLGEIADRSIYTFEEIGETDAWVYLTALENVDDHLRHDIWNINDSHDFWPWKHIQELQSQTNNKRGLVVITKFDSQSGNEKLELEDILYKKRETIEKLFKGNGGKAPACSSLLITSLLNTQKITKLQARKKELKVLQV